MFVLILQDEILSLGGEKTQLQDGINQMSSSEDGNQLFVWGVKKNHGGQEMSSSEDGNQLLVWGVKKNHGVKEMSSSEDGNQLFVWGVKKNHGVKEMSSSADENQLLFWGVKKNHGVKEMLSSEEGNQLLVWSVKKNHGGQEMSSLEDGNQLLVWSVKKDETPFDSQSKTNVVIQEVVPVAEHHHHDHSKSSIFFLEEGLRRGTKLDAHFPKRKYSSPLLPRKIAEHLPFSSEKINEILEVLVVEPKSEKAENVEFALNMCEEPALNGEEKYCATSVESMVDFVTSKLGKNVHVTSTEIENEGKSQKFSVKDGVKILAKEEIISCHPMQYPYVVFYCHKLSNSSAHFMPLEGEDGTRIKAVAVCHKDTSEWDPNHIAFKVLKGKPGTIPVCHFFPEGHLLWYGK